MVTSKLGGEVFDLLIVGAGPAGLSAAVNAKARNLKAIIADTWDPVTKVRTYPVVTKYLGLPQVTGEELANHFAQHFARTGYDFKKQKVLQIIPQDGIFMSSTDAGEVIVSRSVILTVGVAQTEMLPGEQQFLGRGVSYCATCDGALFRGKNVVVVGYIPEGEEEANVLAGQAHHVTYVAAYDEMKPPDPSVDLVRAVPVKITGDDLARVLVTDKGEIKADGFFIVREAVPIASMIDGLRMAENYIEVNRRMASSVPGLFAGGDCTGPPFQISKSVGEGQIAALSAARYVYRERRKEG